jgi:hypothetical protein
MQEEISAFGQIACKPELRSVAIVFAKRCQFSRTPTPALAVLANSLRCRWRFLPPCRWLAAKIPLNFQYYSIKSMI